MEEAEYMNLSEVWHACRKIQDALFRYGFDICSDFCAQDHRNTGLVSETVFTNILVKYKSVATLSDYEIREVVDYFRMRDGRVPYKQFCKVVCSENKIINNGPPKEGATGLEWDDPMHFNVIPRPEDRRHLCLILIKISQALNLPLSPYFEDYELVTKRIGLVTVSHFSRILHFMKINLSDAEFLLLLKRYMKDGYFVNYIAFLKHIDNIKAYLKEHNLLDDAMHIVKGFPGRLVGLDLSKLPAIDGTKMMGNPFADGCNHPKKNKSACDLIFCIQKYVYNKRVRVSEFLESFDQLRTGTITLNQFERGLYNMGVGKLLTKHDMKTLCHRYMDPNDPTRMVWRAFVDEIDRVFTVRNLDKEPDLDVTSLPKYIETLPRGGTKNWGEVNARVRAVCEEAISRIQISIRNRRLFLHPFFRSYDRLRSGHVRCNQAEQIFRTNGILLSPAELEALQLRYGNDTGFNYMKFIEDTDPADYDIPRMVPPVNLQEKCPTNAETPPEEETEEYYIRLLSNVKRQVVARSISVLDFLQDYDRHHEDEILELDFRRGLDNANVKLTPKEMNSICKMYNKIALYFSDSRDASIRDSEDVCSCLWKQHQCFIPGLPMRNSLLFVRNTMVYGAYRQNVAHAQRPAQYIPLQYGHIVILHFFPSFRSSRRGCCTLYREFCKALDEIFIQVERVVGDEVTAVPLIHMANLDCMESFLNFDERTACTQGLMKLARKPDDISNLKQVFQDFDRENCGSIRQNQFLRGLTLREMRTMVSTREYEAILKCFSIERGLHMEFNYREFLNVLNVLYQTGQVKRNY